VLKDKGAESVEEMEQELEEDEFEELRMMRDSSDVSDEEITDQEDSDDEWTLLLLLYRFKLARVTNLVAFAGSSFQVPVKCFVRIKSPAIKGSGQLVVGIKSPPPPK